MTVPLVTTKLLKKDCLKVFLFVLISKSQIEKKLKYQLLSPAQEDY